MLSGDLDDQVGFYKIPGVNSRRANQYSDYCVEEEAAEVLVEGASFCWRVLPIGWSVNPVVAVHGGAGVKGFGCLCVIAATADLRFVHESKLDTVLLRDELIAAAFVVDEGKNNLFKPWTIYNSPHLFTGDTFFGDFAIHIALNILICVDAVYGPAGAYGEACCDDIKRAPRVCF